MKTPVLILSLAISVVSCKKESRMNIPVHTIGAAPVVMSIDGKKSDNPFRVQKPFTDLNTAFLNYLGSRNGGC